MSIALAWCDFKRYCDEIGAGREQPARPAQCVFCEGERVWFNGWRRVLPTLVVDSRRGKVASTISSRAGCGRRCQPSSTVMAGCGAPSAECGRAPRRSAAAYTSCGTLSGKLPSTRSPRSATTSTASCTRPVPIPLVGLSQPSSARGPNAAPVW
jgi:hypothetical protein